MQRDDYRNSFQDVEKVGRYEDKTFGPNSYGDLLWEEEREWLSDFLNRRNLRSPETAYLDFACGTGRVISHLQAAVGRSVGVDISAEMLHVARKKVPRARFLQMDVTAPGSVLPGRFDLITAFRFFLNAQPALREAALEKLAGALAPGGRLVINVQANVPSHRSVRRLVTQATMRRPDHAWLTRAQVAALLLRFGLVVEEEHGYDFLSGLALPLLGRPRLLNWETRLSRTARINRLGGHRIYVARHVELPVQS